jgi:hypothetical protein
LTGHGAEQRTKLDDATRPDHVAQDLLEAVQYILEREKSKVKS